MIPCMFLVANVLQKINTMSKNQDLRMYGWLKQKQGAIHMQAGVSCVTITSLCEGCSDIEQMGKK